MQNIYSHKLFYPVVIFFLVCNFIGIIACYLYSQTALGDELEHLRASYFVSLGEMPYRDFFEHHHPFIWFMFAPIISILPHNNITTLYTAKTLSALFSFGSLVVLYLLIKRFLGGKKVALLAITLSLMYYVSWYGFSLFKPDTFMRFFYLLGLYNFFIFHEEKKAKNLVICGICFTVSFCFLQSILFNIVPIAVAVFYELYKKRIKLIEVLSASVIPLLILVAGIIFLYSQNMWERYFQLNWLFNSKVIEAAPEYSSDVFWSLSFYPLLALCYWFYLIFQKKTDFYINIIGGIILFEFMVRLCTPTFLPHYFIIIFIFTGILYAHALQSITEKVFIYLTIAFLLLQIFINSFMLYTHNNSILLDELKLFDNEKQSETLLTVTSDIFNIYAPKYHQYYWFGAFTQLLAEKTFKYFPDYDVNSLISQNQIKYIYISEQCANDSQAGNQKFYPSAENLHRYEEIKPNLWKLK